MVCYSIDSPVCKTFPCRAQVSENTWCGPSGRQFLQAKLIVEYQVKPWSGGKNWAWTGMDERKENRWEAALHPRRTCLPGWQLIKASGFFFNTSWACYFIPPSAAFLSHCLVSTLQQCLRSLGYGPCTYSSLYCHHLLQCPANSKSPINLHAVSGQRDRILLLK